MMKTRTKRVLGVLLPVLAVGMSYAVELPSQGGYCADGDGNIIGPGGSECRKIGQKLWNELTNVFTALEYDSFEAEGCDHSQYGDALGLICQQALSEANCDEGEQLLHLLTNATCSCRPSGPPPTVWVTLKCRIYYACAAADDLPKLE